MAFHLCAEAPAPLPWKELHQAVTSLEPEFDLFPMPAGSSREPDGLGISVPPRLATEETWQRLERLFALLQTRFGLKVHDLYTGVEVNEATLPEIRRIFLG